VDPTFLSRGWSSSNQHGGPAPYWTRRDRTVRTRLAARPRTRRYLQKHIAHISGNNRDEHLSRCESISFGQTTLKNARKILGEVYSSFTLGGIGLPGGSRYRSASGALPNERERERQRGKQRRSFRGDIKGAGKGTRWKKRGAWLLPWLVVSRDRSFIAGGGEEAREARRRAYECELPKVWDKKSRRQRSMPRLHLASHLGPFSPRPRGAFEAKEDREEVEEADQRQ